VTKGSSVHCLRSQSLCKESTRFCCVSTISPYVLQFCVFNSFVYLYYGVQNIVGLHTAVSLEIFSGGIGTLATAY